MRSVCSQLGLAQLHCISIGSSCVCWIDEIFGRCELCGPITGMLISFINYYSPSVAFIAV